MNDYTRLVLILILLFILSGQYAVRAEDVYALFNYSEKSDVHLVFSRYGPSSPYGLVFSAHPAADFFFDEQGRFRLVYTRRPAAFTTAKRSLYRQVFDGLPVLADIGVEGYGQHQDQRDDLIAGQSGRPVFRSRGAPFSPGPGFMVSQSVALPALATGETEILPDKNWYEIPNSSWYQSWFASDSTGSRSYKIFYDCWEQRDVSINQSTWSGIPVAKIDDSIIGVTRDHRLLRATVDGAMQITDGSQKSGVVLNLAARAAFLRNAFYSWYADAPGSLAGGDNRPDCDIVIESRHPDRRFPMLLSDKRLVVMGTDVLHAWLRASGLPPAGNECSMCAVVPADDYGIFVHSAPDNSLYRFCVKDESVVDFKQTGKITPDFTPVAMTGDNEGNLLLGGFSNAPQAMNNTDDLLMAVEAIDLLPSAPTAKDTRGTILLAQQFYFNLYRLNSENNEILWLGRINVGRHLYQCEFSIAEKPQAITSDVRELLRLAQQNGNHLSLPVRLDEQKQPGQFIMPAQVFIALSQ